MKTANKRKLLKIAGVIGGVVGRKVLRMEWVSLVEQ